MGLIITSSFLLHSLKPRHLCWLQAVLQVPCVLSDRAISSTLTAQAGLGILQPYIKGERAGR